MLSLRFNHLLVVLKIYDTGSLSETVPAAESDNFGREPLAS